MEPAGAERHRRSPEGELAGASESIDPRARRKPRRPTNAKYNRPIVGDSDYSFAATRLLLQIKGRSR